MRDIARDNYFMSAAIEEAKKCALLDEVPVGAVIVRDNKIIASSGNGRETYKDATFHAETEAISNACRYLGGWRLVGCELFVTLEPCIMCGGAIINARVPEVIIGARDPKAGAFGSLCDLNSLHVNHHPNITFGVMEEECADLLRQFFREKRERGKRWKKMNNE
ncbi:MAG: nucleoside deaminase [Clostridia bacterium]|nr:nucleoside deaminase [Clostridia bacterium]